MRESIVKNLDVLFIKELEEKQQLRRWASSKDPAGDEICLFDAFYAGENRQNWSRRVK